MLGFAYMLHVYLCFGQDAGDWLFIFVAVILFFYG